MSRQADLLAAHYAIAPGAAEVAALAGLTCADTETVAMILASAAQYADAHLVPLGRTSDRDSCRFVDGRVLTPDGHRAAWDAFVDGGWLGLDLPEDLGGAGLPNALGIAVQEVLDAACPAFGMMPVPSRAGSRLLLAHGDEATREAWIPKLMSGEYGATIAISEPDAGSDVARLRTKAEPDGEGGWRVTGEKCWISFGDQDLTDRIGHFTLARTEKGISLFLVPSWVDTPDVRNAVVVRRIEEKLGLHLSPTCALGFEGADAILLGEEGRGLAQLFVMITNMRLATGVQGCGIASRAYDAAKGYAAERRQGGRGAAPVPIDTHADVQKMLMTMAADVETLRALNLTVANHADLMRDSADDGVRADAAALNAFLLPIIKTLGGEVAFDTASTAIQVLGGAGYTREWPVEQCLRDARVLTIFEGTTGMQAQDLLFRRMLKGGEAFAAFLSAARADAEAGDALSAALDTLDSVATRLSAVTDRRDLEEAATDVLHLAMLTAQGWMAARLSRGQGAAPTDAHLRATGRYFLTNLPERAAALAARIKADASILADFGELL